MDSAHRSPLTWLCVLALLLGLTGQLGLAEDGARPPIDREEHATVKTATFALG